jgi:hypothetical protein
MALHLEDRKIRALSWDQHPVAQSDANRFDYWTLVAALFYVLDLIQPNMCVPQNY